MKEHMAQMHRHWYGRCPGCSPDLLCSECKSFVANEELRVAIENYNEKELFVKHVEDILIKLVLAANPDYELLPSRFYSPTIDRRLINEIAYKIVHEARATIKIDRINRQRNNATDEVGYTYTIGIDWKKESKMIEKLQGIGDSE